MCFGKRNFKLAKILCCWVKTKQKLFPFCLILLGKAFWFLEWKTVSLWRVLHADATLLARLGGQHIHKRRYWTLWFWRYKNLASSSVSQKQGNGNAPRVFYMHSLYCILSVRCKRANYIQTSAWGFRRCSFRLTGQCESLYSVERVTDWLHALNLKYSLSFWLSNYVSTILCDLIPQSSHKKCNVQITI